jgi:protein tyrosine phosphatase (PTP) superfamily phosphohydrolase (DUF442 family)
MRVVQISFVFILACILPLATAGQTGHADHQAPSESALPRRLYLKGVPAFAEVTPHFYRGGQPTKHGFEGLRKKGVEVVIDLRGNRASERQELTALGMEYIAIPWHCPFPKDATFARFLKVMRANSSKKVFVHCRLGDDRSGMMVAAYRMAEEGWSAEKAMREMKEFGFTSSHHLICPGLAAYEKSFPERYGSNPAFEELRKDKPIQR